MNEGGGERGEDIVCPSEPGGKKKKYKQQIERKQRREIPHTDSFINFFPLSPAFFHEVKGHRRQDNITVLQKHHNHLCSILNSELNLSCAHTHKKPQRCD